MTKNSMTLKWTLEQPVMLSYRNSVRLVENEEKGDNTPISELDHMIVEAVKKMMTKSGIPALKSFSAQTTNTNKAKTLKDMNGLLLQAAQSMTTLSSSFDDTQKAIQQIQGMMIDQVIMDELTTYSAAEWEGLEKNHKRAFEKAHKDAKQKKLEQEGAEVDAQRELEANPNFGMF